MKKLKEKLKMKVKRTKKRKDTWGKPSASTNKAKRLDNMLKDRDGPEDLEKLRLGVSRT